jgi:hypothetical protein
MYVPTFLCLAAAIRLRLNAVALQLLNNLTTPLQFALLLPLERAGAWMCRAAPASGTSLVAKVGVAATHAVLGWVFICVPAGVLLYCALVSVIRPGERCLGAIARRNRIQDMATTR